MGFERPTPIQVQPFRLRCKGAIYGLRADGTGKTAAFLLPSLNALLMTKRSQRLRGASFLVPTLSWALQVGDMPSNCPQDIRHQGGIVYGGVGMRDQDASLRRGADVVVARPAGCSTTWVAGTCALTICPILVAGRSPTGCWTWAFCPYPPGSATRFDSCATMLFSATMPPHILAPRARRFNATR